MQTGKTIIITLVAGLFFHGFSTEWTKQNPLPLEHSLTPYHFSTYTKAYAPDSLHAYMFNGDSVYLYTDNGGNTWSPRTIPGMAGNLAAVKLFSTTVAIVAGHTAWQGTSTGAIFKTFDGGRNWTALPLPVMNEDPYFFTTISNASIVDSLVYDVVFYRNKPNDWNRDLLLMTTRDGGKSWVEKMMPQAWYPADLCFVDSSTGWFTIENSLWSTSDGGSTWQERLLNGYLPRMICFLNRTTGLVVGGEVLRTTDGGTSWKQQTPDCAFQTRVTFSDSLNGWIVLSDNRILHSRDGGKKWAFQYTIGGYDNQIIDVAFANALCGWAVGTNGLILHTSSAPSPVIDSQFAYKDAPYVFHYPGYLDSLDYTYSIHYGPKGMTISKGGTISWTPSVDTFYLQRVELVAATASGQKDSVSFLIQVNLDQKPFTGTRHNVSTKAFGKNGISIVNNVRGGSMRFYISKQASSAEIFNLRGSVLATLKAQNSSQTGAEFSWDLRDRCGTNVVAGTYIVRASCNGFILVDKFTVAR
jgi:photosystem II stability/assembly factor-like uncharacterized protein